MLKPSNTTFLGDETHELLEMQKEVYERDAINPVIMT